MTIIATGNATIHALSHDCGHISRESRLIPPFIILNVSEITPLIISDIIVAVAMTVYFGCRNFIGLLDS
jgi:hypothetical protein